jgi:hypothetical protein
MRVHEPAPIHNDVNMDRSERNGQALCLDYAYRGRAMTLSRSLAQRKL